MNSLNVCQVNGCVAKKVTIIKYFPRWSRGGTEHLLVTLTFNTAICHQVVFHAYERRKQHLVVNSCISIAIGELTLNEVSCQLVDTEVAQ